jgi:hypothetical protein
MPHERKAIIIAMMFHLMMVLALAVFSESPAENI